MGLHANQQSSIDSELKWSFHTMHANLLHDDADARKYWFLAYQEVIP